MKMWKYEGSIHHHQLQGIYFTKGFTWQWIISEHDPNGHILGLPIDHSHMRNTHLVVHAFNGTRKEVIVNIKLPIQIGPCTFNIDFQVMDINPSYNYLLGWPWIHMVGVVPSTPHQKVKFVVEEQWISVAAKKDIVAALTTSNSHWCGWECHRIFLPVFRGGQCHICRGRQKDSDTMLFEGHQDGCQANCRQKSMS